LLPWEAHPEMSLICLLMHYMPTKLITWWREVCILWVQSFPIGPFYVLAGSLFVNLLDLYCSRFDVWRSILVRGRIHAMESVRTFSRLRIPLR
jgi:hypothetical protein